MITSIRKTLKLTPWEVTSALHKAGLIESDACDIRVEVIANSPVVANHTVIISYSNTDRETKDLLSVKQ